MQSLGGKKAIPLCILEILKLDSDADHILTTKEIIEKLDKQYGVTAERKAVSRNIALLCDMGYDICLYEENGVGYYLREREFTEAELRMLIDSVLSSRFIPQRHAQQLIEKLKGLSTHRFAKRMQHVQGIAEWQHLRNDQFFFTLEMVDEAIDKGNSLQFVYNDYGMDGNLHPRRQDLYYFTPYQVVCCEGQYYAIGNSKGHANLSHYRLDLMTNVRIDGKGTPIKSLADYAGGLDIGKYTREHLYMFSGKPQTVVLQMPQSLAGNIVTKFGTAAVMKPVNQTEMQVTLTASVEGLRYWVLQYCRYCQVIAPQELREMVIGDIMAANGK